MSRVNPTKLRNVKRCDKRAARYSENAYQKIISVSVLKNVGEVRSDQLEYTGSQRAISVELASIFEENTYVLPGQSPQAVDFTNYAKGFNGLSLIEIVSTSENENTIKEKGAIRRN